MTDWVGHNPDVARPFPQQRIGDLVRVSTQTFIARGFRRTQMADVAEALGVAKGTIYGYVESKEALFDLAVRFADDGSPAGGFPKLPVRTPKAGATVGFIEARLRQEMEGMILPRILRGEICFADPGEEFEEILHDLLQRLGRNRFTIKLIDRCAVDYPELAEVWFGRGRWEHHRSLVELMQKRAVQGIYRSFGAPEIVARTMIESVAFWGLHRHFDPSPQAVDDQQVRSTLVDLFSRALLVERPI